jgi:hypothetical protein
MVGARDMLIRASILLALVTILFVAPTKESAAQGALKYVFAQLAERDVPTPRDPLGTEADYNHILSRWQAINRAFSGQASGLLHGHFAGLPYKNTYTYEEYKQLIAPKPPPQSWNEAEDQYTRDLGPIPHSRHRRHISFTIFTARVLSTKPERPFRQLARPLSATRIWRSLPERSTRPTSTIASRERQPSG